MKRTSTLLDTSANVGTKTVSISSEHENVCITLNIETVSSALATLSATLYGVDPVASRKFEIMAAGNLGSGLHRFTITPGASTGLFLANDVPPAGMELTITPSVATGSYEYGVGYIGV